MLGSSKKKAQKVPLAINKFVSWQRNNFVPEEIKLFKAKILGMLLYESQRCIYKDFSNLEQIQ